ncbi:MAG: M36 family metallopeptidase, partial [Acidobacteria bacterium]|nr:M36 family metallopeptidase [Acidobacteriota bacterium]
MRLRQQLAGLEVYGTYVKATLTPAGELVSVIENLAPAGGPLLPAQVDYRDALNAVLQRRYPGQPADLPEVSSAENKVTFARGARFYQDPTVTRVAVPLNGGRLRVGYLVETWDHENQLWHTVVNGNGRILFEELRTASDTYKIYPNAPDKTAQTVVSGPGGSSTDSPQGWLVSNTSTTTTGNNVDAYLDRNNDNSADANGRPVSTTQEFVTTVDLTQSPTTTTNQMVAVTNLFYLNNVLHDKLRRHGFTEAAGNFQTNNFGLGGSGNDSVRAEAQDGGGTNNANFATPSDGSQPRMQMYIWTTATPNRDGDLDSDIVYHE